MAEPQGHLADVAGGLVDVIALPSFGSLRARPPREDRVAAEGEARTLVFLLYQKGRDSRIFQAQDRAIDDFTLKGICAGIIAVIDFFWDRFLGTYHRVESENIR
jgi:hypothetical protein